ncbi:putative glyoxylase CFP32 [Nymphon striatum]|nr:putative glyoxylase CFP32 [Nymphon striatum]
MMSDTHGLVWWSELMTRDPEGAKKYYSETCGWTFETMPMEEGDYHVASAQGKMVAGVMDMTGLPGMDGIPPYWFTYIAVDDVDAAQNAVIAAGGKVLRPAFDVPHTGRIVMLEDPTGAAIGLITPSES